jgi:hypothetical protein
MLVYEELIFYITTLELGLGGPHDAYDKVVGLYSLPPNSSQ